ncbi:hypothetical protein RchiOBHm_Chr5g0035561 [Rosa chinensis]|uniref:Uncharacterized protein n=1 Tax=Rosa chinensis TaxID=74649 RepID=A0A2P6QB93_ROSCH|nr:hypothetical protein RchiOBHm_Chr5g0035561 [Rosa chinensis]
MESWYSLVSQCFIFPIGFLFFVLENCLNFAFAYSVVISYCRTMPLYLRFHGLQNVATCKFAIA